MGSVLRLPLRVTAVLTFTPWAVPALATGARAGLTVMLTEETAVLAAVLVAVRVKVSTAGAPGGTTGALKVGVAAAWEAASAAHAPSAEDVRVNDAVLALISLGYKQIDAFKAVKKAMTSTGSTAGATLSVEDLVRHALKLLI